MSMTNVPSEFENYGLPYGVSLYGGNYNTIIDTRLVLSMDVNCYLQPPTVMNMKAQQTTSPLYLVWK